MRYYTSWQEAWFLCYCDGKSYA